MLKFLLIILLFIQPFGEVLRIPSAGLDDEVFGLQTLIAVCIIIYGIFDGSLFKGLTRNKQYALYPVFVAWGALVTLMTPYAEMLALRSFIQNIYYLIFMLVIAGQTFTAKQTIVTILSYCTGFALVSILSLLDYYHYIAIPGFNEVTGSREIMGAYTTEVITNLTGPFSSRTTFANYCALAIGCNFGLFFLSVYLKNKILTLLSSGFITLSCMVALASLSRGLFLVVFVVLIYGVAIMMFKMKSSIRLLIPIVAVGLIALLGLSSSQKYRGILANFVSSINITEAQADESSSVRFILWKAAFQDPVVWAIGRGYVPIYSEEHNYGNDPHNTAIWLFYIGGLPGLVLLTIIFKDTLLYLFRFQTPYALTAILAVIGYLSYGITHTAWHFSAFWGFLGILLSVMHTEKTNIFPNIPVRAAHPKHPHQGHIRQ